MSDTVGPSPLLDLPAFLADAPAVGLDDVACLLATDGSVLWATRAGRALAARLDRPSRARLLSRLTTTDLPTSHQAPLGSPPFGETQADRERLRAGGINFSARCQIVRLRAGGKGMLVDVAEPTPRAWSHGPALRASGSHASVFSSPIPPPATAASQPLQTLEKLRAKAGGRTTLRFVWHADAQGIIRSVSAGLERVLEGAIGADTGIVGKTSIIGRSWADLTGQIDAADAIDRHVHSGKAWSGLTSAWRLNAIDPGAGGHGADDRSITPYIIVPVEFGGAPIRDEHGAAAGQRGYGLMRLEAATETPPATISPTPANDAVGEAAREPVRVDEADFHGGPGLPDEVQPGAVSDQQLTADRSEFAQTGETPNQKSPNQESWSVLRSEPISQSPESEAATGAPQAPKPAERPTGLSAITARLSSGSNPVLASEPLLPLFAPRPARPEAAGRPPLPPDAGHGPDAGNRADSSPGAVEGAVAEPVSSGSPGRAAETPAPALIPALDRATDSAPVPAHHADVLRKSAAGDGRLTRGEHQTLRDIARALGASVSNTSPGVSNMSHVREGSPDAPGAVSGAAPADIPAAAPIVPAQQTVIAHTPEPNAAVASSSSPDNTSDGRDRPPINPADAQAESEAETGAIQARTIQDLIQALPVAALVSRDGVAIHANAAFLALTRQAGMADVAGRRLENLFPDSALAPDFSGKGTVAGARGVSTPVTLGCVAAPWPRGDALLVLAIPDASAGLAARVAHLEQELAGSLAREVETRGVLDTATDGVVVLDAQGRILSFNRSAEALFGYEQNELVGEPFTRLLAPGSDAVARDYLDSLRSSGVASLLNDGRDVTGRVRQGGDCRLFMTLGKLGDGRPGDSQQERYCAVLRDITAWKRTESELIESKRRAENANAQKSDFLARMSHEVRTPLGAMIGFSELMLEERFGPIQNPRYREYVRDIHESGQYVISLVNDLLDLARIEAGKMDLTFASVDLNAVLQACVALMQPQASKAHIVLRSSLDATLPPVVVDERSMRQIALNVLGNALKFTDAGGQVILSSSRSTSGEVVIRVRDTGIGMTEHELGEALKPFRRLAPGRKAPGTGLGLPLTVALVEANRGSLRISSTPGEGTLVEVVLPPSRVLAN